jgi:hypothetical protein
LRPQPGDFGGGSGPQLFSLKKDFKMSLIDVINLSQGFNGRDLFKGIGFQI